MDTVSTSSKTLAKAGAALVVSLGLVTQLSPAPAQAGGKDAALFIGGVLAGVVVTQAINNSQRNQYSPPPPPPRYSPPSHNPPRHNPPRRSPPPRPVVRRPYYNPAETMRIQAALNTLGYDAGVVDGVMGRGTRAAASVFQYETNARPTGTLTHKQKVVLFDRARYASQNTTQPRANNQNNQNTASPNNTGQNNQTSTSRINQNTTTQIGTTGSTGSSQQPQPVVAQQPQPVTAQQPQPVTAQTTQAPKLVSSRQGRIKIQQALNVLGYPAGKENGRMTAQTREAIKAFQLDISHEATGLLSAEERTILFRDAADLSAENAAPDQVPGEKTFNDS